MSRKTVMTAQDIDLAIHRISFQILEKNHDRGSMAIVGIHICGVYVARRIHRAIEKQTGLSIPFGTLDINLYRDDWSLISQNPVVKTTKISFDVDNTNLILVDDVIFTGRTVRAALDAIIDYGRPNTIQLAALVDRGGRELPVQPDYVGMVTGIQQNERITVLLNDQGDDGEVIVES